MNSECTAGIWSCSHCVFWKVNWLTIWFLSTENCRIEIPLDELWDKCLLFTLEGDPVFLWRLPFLQRKLKRSRWKSCYWNICCLWTWNGMAVKEAVTSQRQLAGERMMVGGCLRQLTTVLILLLCGIRTYLLCPGKWVNSVRTQSMGWGMRIPAEHRQGSHKALGTLDVFLPRTHACASCSPAHHYYCAHSPPFPMAQLGSWMWNKHKYICFELLGMVL